MEETEYEVFVDTNTFLHVRDLKDIPWRELEGLEKATRVDIMIASAVLSELDRHKVGGKRRRRDRSRAALNLIVDASKQKPEPVLVLREKPVEVRLCLAGKDIDWSKTRVLDQGNPDDQIVAEAIMYGPDTVVLSHDTRPRVKAFQNGLVAHEPKEEWLLPEEETDEDAKIKALNKALEFERSRKPALQFAFKEEDETEPTVEFQLKSPKLTPLPEVVVERLSRRYIADNPRVSRAERNPLGEHYRRMEFGYDALYDGFEKKVREYYRSLRSKITQRTRYRRLPYTLSNMGAVTAEGARIDMELEGDAYLISNYDLDNAYKELVPPEAPSTDRTREELRRIADQYSLPTIPDRDSTGLYWVGAPPSVGDVSGAVQCEELRPGVHMHRGVALYLRGDWPVRGEIGAVVSAKNSPTTISAKARFVFEEEDVSWKDERILALLPEKIRRYFHDEQLI